MKSVVCTILRWDNAEDYQAFIDAMPILAAANHPGGGRVEHDLAAMCRRLIAESAADNAARNYAGIAQR